MKNSVCCVCGKPAPAGNTVCPSCRILDEKRAARSNGGRLRPIWNNASHDGKPVAYMIVGGADNGKVLEAVRYV